MILSNRLRAAFGVAAVVAVFADGCVRPASTVEPTAVGAPPRPTVSCPDPVTSQTFTGLPLRISFAPQAAGGILPLSFSCTPPSGAAFPIGTTTVVCTVTDAAAESSTCSFTVRVLGPPRLSATHFLAFGDSITFGQTFDSYPGRLLDKLRARYQTQETTVVNDGKDGELASVGGRQRLPFALDVHRPQVLLLIEGSNDLIAGSATAGRALDALTEMVRLAKGRGVLVMLGTVPPQRAGGARDASSKLVAGFNDGVRQIAQREAVTLVDIYAAMVGDPTLIGRDDLHPNERGHEVMAQTFFDVITKQLELPPAGVRTR